MVIITNDRATSCGERQMTSLLRAINQFCDCTNMRMLSWHDRIGKVKGVIGMMFCHRLTAYHNLQIKSFHLNITQSGCRERALQPHKWHLCRDWSKGLSFSEDGYEEAAKATDQGPAADLSDPAGQNVQLEDHHGFPKMSHRKNWFPRFPRFAALKCSTSRYPTWPIPDSDSPWLRTSTGQ